MQQLLLFSFAFICRCSSDSRANHVKTIVMFFEACTAANRCINLMAADHPPFADTDHPQALRNRFDAGIDPPPETVIQKENACGTRPNLPMNPPLISQIQKKEEDAVDTGSKYASKHAQVNLSSQVKCPANQYMIIYDVHFPFAHQPGWWLKAYKSGIVYLIYLIFDAQERTPLPFVNQSPATMVRAWTH